MKKPETIRAWAWEVLEKGRWRLCYWTLPTRPGLLLEKKPSPEARPVCVRIMRNRDWPVEGKA